MISCRKVPDGGMFPQSKTDGSRARRNLPTGKAFRYEVSGCCGHAKDAVFHTVDALWTDDRARSFPQRSVPLCERRWPSVSEALEEGDIDPSRVSNVCARLLPSCLWEHILWGGIDGSGMACPPSRTSADRSAQYVQTRPEWKKPVTSGWPCSTAALPQTASRWTSPR